MSGRSVANIVGVILALWFAVAVAVILGLPMWQHAYVVVCDYWGCP